MGKAASRGKQGKLTLGTSLRLEKDAEEDAAMPKFSRNRLVSKMLQDRGVLRLISAPRGYGKTSLAREYAERLFSGKRVNWVDASSPTFLAELDKGQMQGFEADGGDRPDLIVLDDVPWLHEQRAQRLSDCIDLALGQGVEIVATTLPSCDCLSSLQSERVFIGAGELEITEQECLDGQGFGEPNARVHALRMWRTAKTTFMGKVATVAWGDDEESVGRVLEGFFCEKLSAEVLRAALAILVLGKGSLSALASVGFAPRTEDLRILARDYPFLGIDVARGRFAVPKVSLDLLQRALDASGASSSLGDSLGKVTGRTLQMLLQEGDSDRVEELLEVFCTDEQCAQWLLECGWALLDKGKFELVDALLNRCPEGGFADMPMLLVLRSWSSGLLGDEMESVYCAQKTLRAWGSGALGDDEYAQAIGALSYLSLAAFGEHGALIYGKDEFSSAEEPILAEGFIARVVDLCTETEIERAFAHGGSVEAQALEKRRKPAGEERANALSALFSKNGESLHGEFLYRLGFHLLCHVDSEVLKPVVSGIACELFAGSRRKELSTCSGALLVRDMWRRGFIKLSGRSTDKRDGRLLEDAGRMLKTMAEQREGAVADVPWEVESVPRRIQEGAPRRGHREDGVDIMNVRLFGTFEVVVGDRCIKESEWRKKSRTLIVLLLLNQGRDVSRDTLFAELWPDMSRVRALDNFYSVWSNACALLGNGPYLERQESFCRINAQYVTSDVGEFERLVRQLLTERLDTNALLDTYARLEALYRGGLVPSETENQTINAQRTRYEAMYIDAMIAATDCSLKANDARLALWFARKAMETGQQREDLYQALVRAQIAAGQRCSAIKTYFECREYLREKLGLDPSCETQDLYERLITVDPSLLKLDPSSFKR